MSSTTENAWKVHQILQIFAINPVSIENSQFCNSTKLAYHRLEVQKVIEFF